jgi:four helix bundle protein
MSIVKRFEDLNVWQKARALCKDLNPKITEGKFGRDFGLRDQLNRSSGSVMDNIAEGFEREGKNEFIQFLSYAKGSSGEVRSQLYRAFDRQYLNSEELKEFLTRTEEVTKMLTGLIIYLKKSSIQGLKYKKDEA